MIIHIAMRRSVTTDVDSRLEGFKFCVKHFLLLPPLRRPILA
jgi:hypothetical protein